MAITILELAKHRGAVENEEDGAITSGEVIGVGLPFFAGCELCGASLSCYNSYPSKSGFVRCKTCIGDLGWDTEEQANRDIFGSPETVGQEGEGR